MQLMYNHTPYVLKYSCCNYQIIINRIIPTGKLLEWRQKKWFTYSMYNRIMSLLKSRNNFLLVVEGEIDPMQGSTIN